MSDRYHDETALFDDGSNGLTAAAFIRSIRQAAIAQEKHADDLWMAHYAASRLDGEALDWYEELEGDTQDSWKEMRRVFLVRWPVRRQDSKEEPATIHPEAATIPTPAAAAPPAPAAASPSAVYSETPEPEAPARVSSADDLNLQDLTLDTSGSGANVNTSTAPLSKFILPRGNVKGKLKVCDLDGKLRGYIANDPTPYGYLAVAAKPKDAPLIVNFDPSLDVHYIYLNPEGRNQKRYLAMAWVNESVFVKTFKQGNSFGYLVAATRHGSSSNLISSVHNSSATAHGVAPRVLSWLVLIDGSVICLKEDKPNSRRILTTMLGVKTRRVMYGTSLEDFMLGEDAKEYHEVKMMFEPL